VPAGRRVFENVVVAGVWSAGSGLVAAGIGGGASSGVLGAPCSGQIAASGATVCVPALGSPALACWMGRWSRRAYDVRCLRRTPERVVYRRRHRRTAPGAGTSFTTGRVRGVSFRLSASPQIAIDPASVNRAEAFTCRCQFACGGDELASIRVFGSAASFLLLSCRLSLFVLLLPKHLQVPL